MLGVQKVSGSNPDGPTIDICWFLGERGKKTGNIVGCMFGRYWRFSLPLGHFRTLAWQGGRRNYPLKAPGAAHAMRSDCPVEMARDAAHRLWEAARGVARTTSESASVGEVCDLFVAAMRG